MGSILDWSLEQLKQNSTWRGLIQIATAAGVVVNPVQAANIIAIGLAAVGLIDTIRKGARGFGRGEQPDLITEKPTPGI